MMNRRKFLTTTGLVLLAALNLRRLKVQPTLSQEDIALLAKGYIRQSRMILDDLGLKTDFLKGHPTGLEMSAAEKRRAFLDALRLRS